LARVGTSQIPNALLKRKPDMTTDKAQRFNAIGEEIERGIRIRRRSLAGVMFTTIVLSSIVFAHPPLEDSYELHQRPTITREQVVEPVVERTSAGRIAITGATYARTAPAANVLAGFDIPLANMSWVPEEGGTIIFGVNPGMSYTVMSAVYYLHDADDIQAEIFTVEVPVSRADKVQHFLELTIQARELKSELGEITFFDMIQAMERIREEQEQVNEHNIASREARTRNQGDDQGDTGEGTTGVFDPKPASSSAEED